MCDSGMFGDSTIHIVNCGAAARTINNQVLLNQFFCLIPSRVNTGAAHQKDYDLAKTIPHSEKIILNIVPVASSAIHTASSTFPLFHMHE